MVLSEVKEYQPAVAELISNISSKNKAANLYVFYGPANSGRSTYARRFFFELNQISESKFHQDLYTVNSEKKISIDQIRYIQDFVKFGPREADYLVVVIENAQKMTIPAANAFLKTLEEPLYPFSQLF